MTRLAVLASAILAAGVVFAGTTAAVAGGTTRPPDQPHGVHITPLSHATIGSNVRVNHAGIKIATRGPRDMLVTSIVVDPGGSFGWHTHPGPVLVAVSAGTLTLYQADEPGCPRTTVTAGQAFIEDGADVHLARNEGSGPVELNAIFLARTGTTEFLTSVPRPRGCHV